MHPLKKSLLEVVYKILEATQISYSFQNEWGAKFKSILYAQIS